MINLWRLCIMSGSKSWETLCTNTIDHIAATIMKGIHPGGSLQGSSEINAVSRATIGQALRAEWVPE
jgi:hypothetical protein